MTTFHKSYIITYRYLDKKGRAQEELKYITKQTATQNIVLG